MSAIQLLRNFVTVILFCPLFAMADNVAIGVLPSSVCNLNSDDFNSHVYSNGRCVLYFPRESKGGKEIEHESEALLLINGKVIRVIKNKDAAGYFFSSKEHDVHVNMQVKEVGTSCVEGEDKCCGSDYKGTLSVRTPSGYATVPVDFYRGG